MANCAQTVENQPLQEGMHKHEETERAIDMITVNHSILLSYAPL